MRGFVPAGTFFFLEQDLFKGWRNREAEFAIDLRDGLPWCFHEFAVVDDGVFCLRIAFEDFEGSRVAFVGLVGECLQ